MARCLLKFWEERVVRAPGPVGLLVSLDGAGSAARPPPARILLADPDPYLAYLVKRQFPAATVEELSAGACLEAIDPPDVLLVDLDRRSAPEALAGTAVIGVRDGRGDSESSPRGLADVLVRPYLPTEVRRTIRRALGEQESPAESAHTRLRLPWVLDAARIGAVALASVLELTSSSAGRWRGTILAFAFAYAALRIFVRPPAHAGSVVDVATAATLIGLTGGLASNYAAFALVGVIGAGMCCGVRLGAVAGVFAASGAIYDIALQISADPSRAYEAAAWCAAFVLGGLAGGFAGKVRRVSDPEGLETLAEANRVLSTLYRIARAVPESLEVGAIASAVMSEVREVLRAPAGLVAISDAGSFGIAASFGFPRPEALARHAETAALQPLCWQKAGFVPGGALPPDLAESLGGHDCLVFAPLRRDGVLLGLIVCVCSDDAHHERNRMFVQQLAEETAVAVENAQLFGRVRELSIDEERRRLARELHDGVAQALTHLRLELDFMSRYGGIADEEARESIGRLSRVVDRAGEDVRSMIGGLRSPVSPEGLARSLRAYLRDLRGIGGPEILFDAVGQLTVRPEIEAEVFRIAQESVSNALRHARATRIRVVLSSTGRKLLLAVEDNGVGLRDDRGSGKGLGLTAMRERAAKIGASVSVTGVPGSGTRVEVACPIQNAGAA